MKARINTFAFRTTAIESASLGVLGTVAHRLDSKGEFRGVVYKGEIVVATFDLTVSPDATSMQADVDLAKLGSRGRARRDGFRYSVQPEGYLLLYVSEGAGGYHVVVEAPGEERAVVIFDSRKLNTGDLFVVTLLRPGRYEMRGDGVEGTGSIRVTYPEPARVPYVPGDVVRIATSTDGFDPSSVTVGPAQGVVFDVGAENVALVVDCKEPDDGPTPPSGLKRRSPLRRKFVDRRSSRP